MSSNESIFQDRVARLSQTHTQQQKARAASMGRQKPEWRRNLGHVLRFPLATVMGALSVMIGRYVQLQMVGVPEPGAGFDAAQIAPIGICIVMLMVVAQVLRLNDAQFKTAATVGIIGMILLMHNLVHAYPDLFAQIYSADWVTWQTAMTEPDTINLFGRAVPLG